VAHEASRRSAGTDRAARTPEPDDLAGGERRAPGALEAEILAILRLAQAPLSPGQVRDRLPAEPSAAQLATDPAERATAPKQLSYSTVVTIMSRLYAKGLLARQRSGRGFSYAALDDASLAASRMRQALGSEHDHSAVLSRFVSDLSTRDARLLRQLLTELDSGRTGDHG
jgi:predicted transcriptional regulator